MATHDDGTCAAVAASSSSFWITLLSMALAFPTVFWLLGYLLPQIYMCLRPVPNLKRRYPHATWALVTGAGSGIGRAIAFQLAQQELNVVLVSLDDDFLQQTTQVLRAAYPQQEFRAVGVHFAPGVNYMKTIIEATKDLEIPILFNNAGFMVTGFVDQAPLGKLLTNLECNATAALQLSHHFVRPLMAAKRTGCIVFTSSVAAYMPSPFAALYSATKAFLSTLAYSMYIELQPRGIDVVVIHPSPVASQFYAQLDHQVDLIQAAAQNAVAPDAIVHDIFRSIGAGCASRDLGTLAWCTRLGTWCIPSNVFCALFATAAPYLPDWKTHNKNR